MKYSLYFLMILLISCENPDPKKCYSCEITYYSTSSGVSIGTKTKSDFCGTLTEIDEYRKKNTTKVPPVGTYIFCKEK